MRYNSTYQAQADRLAKEDDTWYFAEYIGHYHGFCLVGEQTHDWLVFEPLHKDSISRCEGFPQYILVDEKECIWAPDSNVFDIMHKTLYFDDVKKGRSIFRGMEERLKNAFMLDQTEYQYLKQVVKFAYNPMQRVPHPNRLLLIYLQTAERLGKKLEFKDDYWELV